MAKNIPDEITVLSSRSAGRKYALTFFAGVLIMLVYVFLPPQWTDFLREHAYGRSKWLFGPTFVVQKIIGLALLVLFAGLGALFWKTAEDGKEILHVSPEGVRLSDKMLHWQEISEMMFGEEKYIIYTNDLKYEVPAIGAGTHRDEVLEVVKKVKPSSVRLDYE